MENKLDSLPLTNKHKFYYDIGFKAHYNGDGESLHYVNNYDITVHRKTTRVGHSFGFEGIRIVWEGNPFNIKPNHT